MTIATNEAVLLYVIVLTNEPLVPLLNVVLIIVLYAINVRHRMPQSCRKVAIYQLNFSFGLCRR